MRKCISFFFFLSCLSTHSYAQKLISTLFELRQITLDTSANGETDFKGPTAWMDTEQRIDFLNSYADYTSGYFENKNLDKEIVTDSEISNLLTGIKQQPRTTIRKTIPLDKWTSYGYEPKQDIKRKNELQAWSNQPGATISKGSLILDNTKVNRDIDSLLWRFNFECNIQIGNNSKFSLGFLMGTGTLMYFDIEKGLLTTGSANKSRSEKIDTHSRIGLVLEADMTEKRFNLYVNGNLVGDFIPMNDTAFSGINSITINSRGKCQVDNVFLLNHIPLLAKDSIRPFISKIVLNENFEEKSSVENWQNFSFDDTHWDTVDLPAVHGGLKEVNEDFYLRKKVRIEDFERATLSLETLDPGGEIWINGEIIAVINDRYPHDFDLTRYLKKNAENLIAIKVKSYTSNIRSPHAPWDKSVGWFLGRSFLKLSSKCMIKNVLVSTSEIGEKAVQSHKIHIQYNHHQYFKGTIEINYYPWFPVEGTAVASFTKEIQVRPRIENEYVFECPVPDVKLWSAATPHLYKVQVILKDADGKPIDDFVTTTGIRTVKQMKGDFYINGKPEVLIGAQIMGMRTPIETMAKFIRCAPIETVAEEMIMLKKMGANLLRLHVHAESDTTDGINDPRYAEFADQMGINLIWSTAGFMRAGESWNVDFEGYPKYMKQVYNHPSIVIWEAANHPNQFKEHDISDTEDYVRKIYHTIFGTDKTRLISPTSFWEHTKYANYDGTLDDKGNKITPVPEYMAEAVTRGSQDAYTGYGADWSNLRLAPSKWAASCLKARDKAYFNFEHEESMGQPNWTLSKGKPWHLLHSYEWYYDEGSIGRKLSFSEWRASQAWQAFSAYESMKKQLLLGYDGFSWCTLHGGSNMGTYMKPLIDNSRHPKLVFYIHKMLAQKSWAASNDADVVYGPADLVKPVIHHLADDRQYDLVIRLTGLNGKLIDKKVFKKLEFGKGRETRNLSGFRFKDVKEGTYVMVYDLYESRQ